MKAPRPKSIALLLGLALALPCITVLAQDQPAQQPNAGSPGGAQPQGQEEAPVPPQSAQNERVPVTGIEDYRLSGISLGRSFIVGQAQLNEIYGTNTNGAATATGAQNDSITNLQGMLSVQWLSRKSTLDIDYRPSLVIFDQGTVGTSLIQAFSVTDKFLLRRWTLLLGDDFTYLPQSPFGLGAYGFGGSVGQGIPGVGGGIININPFFVPGQSIQSIGGRISNAVVSQAQYTFGPRASVNLSGSFAQLHFFNAGFLNTKVINLRGGYDYLMSARNTFTLAYTRNQVYYPTGIAGFSGDAVSVGFRRMVNGKMSFTGETGPQFTHFQPLGTSPVTRTSYFVRGIFQVRTSRNTIEATYQHRLTEGSGVLVGAQSDLIGTTLVRLLSRNWTGSVASNFSRNARLNQTTGAVTSSHFNFWTASVMVSRNIGLNTQLNFHYNVSRQTSNFSGCVSTVVCGNVSLQQQIGVGLSWNSRLYSLD